MELEDLMGQVVDELYSGLTGGTAELPLPNNVMLNWLMPGLSFHESAFDFAIAGPFAGPTPLTLDYFKELVEALRTGRDPAAGDGEATVDDTGGGGAQPPMDQAKAVEEAKRMYQQHLLGSWEQWSRLVDFIPLPSPELRYRTETGAGKHKHVSVVYAQAGQTLSQVYKDTLTRCWVADDKLTEEQKKIVARMKLLLSEVVEEEDFLTGKMEKVEKESRIMIAYKAKKAAYENAVIDYAVRLSKSQSGTAADLIEWQQSGGLYRRKATEALRDWIATGYKNDVERAQATLSHILGSSMVVWKDNLVQILANVENNTTGSFGYPFYPASVLPGGFARSSGWTQFNKSRFSSSATSNYSRRSGGASGGLNLGLFRIGGSGGATTTKERYNGNTDSFRLSFEYTTVEIMRPTFNPSFFLSRGWKPKDTFIRDYEERHSDGKNPPKGALIGYPTKALFVRNLVISHSQFSSWMKSKQSDVKAGASFGWGPFSIGGRYQQSNKYRSSNISIQGESVHIRGLQLVGFLSVLFPYTANPSPDVKSWV